MLSLPSMMSNPNEIIYSESHIDGISVSAMEAASRKKELGKPSTGWTEDLKRIITNWIADGWKYLREAYFQL